MTRNLSVSGWQSNFDRLVSSPVDERLRDQKLVKRCGLNDLREFDSAHQGRDISCPFMIVFFIFCDDDDDEV
jgi:hypothetical protein